MVDINEISTGLFKKEGIWFKESANHISYPEEGNKLCFEIEDGSYWFKHRNNILEAILRSFPPDGSIFDIGGGNGFVTKRMEELGYEAVLLEPGSEGVKNAKMRGVKHIINASMDENNFANSSFDNACLFDVLEHIEDPDKFLRLLHRLLKDQGRLYLTVPAYKFLWSNEDKVAGHYIRYTRKSLKKLLIKLGFKVEYSSYFFSILILPIFLLRTIPSWFIGHKQDTESTPAMSDHHMNNTLVNNLLNRIWRGEYNRIKSLKGISFGSSIIMVCKKDTNL